MCSSRSTLTQQLLLLVFAPWHIPLLVPLRWSVASAVALHLERCASASALRLRACVAAVGAVLCLSAAFILEPLPLPPMLCASRTLRFLAVGHGPTTTLTPRATGSPVSVRPGAGAAAHMVLYT